MAEQVTEKEQVHIAVVLTCYNRKEKTKASISSLAEHSAGYYLEFIVTDDQSTDQTAEALRNLPYSIRILEGTGKLFWNGGMNRSMEYVLNHAGNYQYVMLINDDVIFYKDAIERLMKRFFSSGADIVVGSTVDSKGNMSYGGVRKTSKRFAKYELIEPTDKISYCDTFNCNCILMKIDTFCSLGTLDPVYIHSMGDYDYGMTAVRKGLKIANCDAHIGRCDDNDQEGTWKDVSLSRKERLRLKESPKGLPKHDWYYFLKKNYGFMTACYHSITPYIRIILGK